LLLDHPRVGFSKRLSKKQALIYLQSFALENGTLFWVKIVGRRPFEMDASDVMGINLARLIYS